MSDRSEWGGDHGVQPGIDDGYKRDSVIGSVVLLVEDARDRHGLDKVRDEEVEIALERFDVLGS